VLNVLRLSLVRLGVVLVKSVGRHGKAEARPVPVIGRVELAHEHVTHDVKGSAGRWHVEAHECQ